MSYVTIDTHRATSINARYSYLERSGSWVLTITATDEKGEEAKFKIFSDNKLAIEIEDEE
jgi:hypothetical protein